MCDIVYGLVIDRALGFIKAGDNQTFMDLYIIRIGSKTTRTRAFGAIQNL